MPAKKRGAGRRAPQNKKTFSAVLSAIVVLAAVLIYYFPELRDNFIDTPPVSAAQQPSVSSGENAEDAPCAVYYLDVGQGDSILIRIGDYNMLIDASVREAGDTIEADLSALGVQDLDAVIATHPHADHIGSMTQIINDYDIDTFYMPVLPDDQTPTTATYENMLDALLDKNVKVEEINTETNIPAPENARFAVLSPEKGETFDDVNDYSAVIRFTYGNVSFMLTGDAETPVEENILARAEDISAAVLKCGHHGSSTSSSMAFLRRVNPAVAIISCGQDNKYGHPHRETLESLDALQCKVMRTDTDGTIAVTTDGDSYSVYTWSPENGLSPAA